MSQRQQLFLFMTLFLSIMYSLSLFIMTFFGHAFNWSWNWILGSACLTCLSISTYLIGGQSAHSKKHVILKGIGGVSMGVMSIAFSVSALGWVALWIGSPKLLTGQLGLVMVIISAVIGLLSSYSAPKAIHHKLKIGPGHQHLRVVQLSDLHINGLKHQQWTHNLVDQINATQPDIIVFTGDLADVQEPHANAHLQILKKLHAAKGKFAISGNHDFYNDYSVFQKMLQTMDFQCIDNQVLEIAGLYIAGISDKDGQRFGYPRPDIRSVLAQRSKNLPTLLLDHRPDHFKENIPTKINLQLSGHTHGGQLPPWNLIIRVWHRFSAGLYTFGNSQIYISKGTGTWGPPIRLFAKSEVTYFELRY